MANPDRRGDSSRSAWESRSPAGSRRPSNLASTRPRTVSIVWDGLNARIAGMLGGFNIRFGHLGDVARFTIPERTDRCGGGDYADTVRGQAGLGHSAPVHGDEHLPAHHRDVWRSGGLGTAGAPSGPPGTGGTGDLPPAAQCAALLSPGYRPMGAAPEGSTWASRRMLAEVAGGQSQSSERNGPRLLRRAFRVGHQKTGRRRRASIRASSDGTLVRADAAHMGVARDSQTSPVRTAFSILGAPA